MLAIRRKKSQSLADLHDKSLSAASVIRDPLPPVTKLLAGPKLSPKLSPGAEESGYDSDTRKSAETVSPKSSDKSDESDSGQDTSGSFTSENHKDSDTDPDTEPHYQVTEDVFFCIYKKINSLQHGVFCNFFTGPLSQNALPVLFSQVLTPHRLNSCDQKRKSFLNGSHGSHL